MDIDPRFGLPSEAGVFEEIAKGEQKITVTTVARRYGKITTLVSGFDKSFDIKATAKHLKEKLPAEAPSRTASSNCRATTRNKSDQCLLSLVSRKIP